MTKDKIPPTPEELLKALGDATYKALASHRNFDDDQTYQAALDAFVYREPGTQPERKRVPKSSSVDETLPQQLRKDLAAITAWFLPESEEIRGYVRGDHEPFWMRDEQAHLKVQFHPGTNSSVAYAYSGPNEEEKLAILRSERDHSYMDVYYDNSRRNLHGSVSFMRRKSSKKWDIQRELARTQQNWEENTLQYEEAMQAAGNMAQQILKLLSDRPPREFTERNMKTRR